MGWDYIVVHESAHEWWGNSVSAKDHADMWIHESFGMYAEALWLECSKSRAAGERYLVGVRQMIKNDVPIIGRYGVQDVPRSQDRYPKGANMLMTMRAVVDDDAKWQAALRAVQERYRHQTVTASQVRDLVSATTGVDLSKIFRQYLETTQIPTLEYRFDGAKLAYRWTNVLPGFDMPLRVGLAPEGWTRLRPTTEWQSAASPLPAGTELRVDPAFYVVTKKP
jgi:aminopeptidase N